MLIGLLILGPIVITIVWSVIRLILGAFIYAARRDK
jgi:hypothetical protein